MQAYSTPYREADESWPWGRVLFFYNRITEYRFTAALPVYESMALQANMNRKKGSQPLKGTDFMPAFMVPEHLRDDDRIVPRYSWLVVEAFEEALELGFVSNGILAALDTRVLRASGADF